MGAYDSIKSYDIELIVTVVRNEKAVKLYIQGKLPNLMDTVTYLSVEVEKRRETLQYRLQQQRRKI